jgi:hypothetical protein
MKTFHRIISLALVAFLLSSGLPLFTPQDANRDTVVGLDDAILHLMDFARTADDPVTFTSSVEKLLSTLQAVAGLKTVLEPDHDTQSSSPAFFLDSPYLISSYDGSTASNSHFLTYKKSSFYESIVSTPFSPPPELA